MSDRPRVLIADAQENSGALVSLLLGREGFRVDWQHDWEEAVLAAGSLAPQLLILDPTLMQSTPLLALEQARLIPSFQDLPILLLLTKRDAATFPLEQVTATQDFLIRPLQARQVMKKLKRHFSESLPG